MVGTGTVAETPECAHRLHTQLSVVQGTLYHRSAFLREAELSLEVFKK